MSLSHFAQRAAAQRSQPALLASVLALLFLELAAPGEAAPGFVFVDVTSPALADTQFAYDKKGVAFQDYDGDGDLDICRTGEGVRALSLFRNDGGDQFTDVTAAVGLARGGSASGQTWGDYDNDGDLDLFVSIEENPPRLFRNDGAAGFVEVTSGPMTAPAHGHSASWVDYDRDGDLDLYVANLNQASRLFRNEGGDIFTDVTSGPLGASGGDGVAWGDYDNDGDPDLSLIRFSQLPSFLIRNDNGTFVDVTVPPLDAAPNGHSGAWADYDNDGDLDLFYADANFPNHLLRNDGGTFVDVTPSNVAMGGHSLSPCWGDYDNDGDLDLYVTSRDGGICRMFRNDGGGVFTDVTTFSLAGTGNVAGVACGDYDGDGDLDLYTSSYGSLPNKLLRNNLGNSNHWLEVDLEGTISNRSAIGARAWLTTPNGVTQMREVSGCTGFRSQSALTVHFGLGAADRVTLLRIRWPSGNFQDTTLSTVDHRFRMVEPRTNPTGRGDEIHAPRLVLLGAVPDPFRSRTRIEYDLPAAGKSTLSIVDLQGRVVRMLDRGVLAAGRHAETWDGRREDGARAGAGVYFCVLEACGRTLSRKLVLVP